MKSLTILLTGSTGYIGRRLLPVLLEQGHHIICLVRDKRRFDFEDFSEEHQQHLTVVEADLNNPDTLKQLPKEIDLAYYLVHSMSTSEDFLALEQKSAETFVGYINQTTAKQIIYLSGIVNDPSLSKHLSSRKNVEDILSQSTARLTVLRAAIIIGSGSASFEIIRDLVEKLPVMIAPKWLKSRCQPIGIRNVIEYLIGVILKEETFGQSFDIGGPDIVTYKEMLMGYARVRGLKRWIIPVPVLSPQLSSHWLYFVTSTSFTLAKSLVSSLKNEVICSDNRIQAIVPVKLLNYEETLRLTLDRIQQRLVISSWKDAVPTDAIDQNFLNYIEVPTFGCFSDKRTITFNRPKEEVIENIWKIGGDQGWYYGNWMWGIRGFVDKLFGGVGLRRGRRNATDLKAGDALDFWRVLLTDKKNGRLLLYAEMKLPGEAWLEFKIQENTLVQTATFRPLGLWGRIYWYAVLPFHGLIFPGMIRNIVRV
ncbi:MAG: SDR family oxidoreductase [Cyclobacteriaceae bacterium]|nr:SDR family oxidoreductase [Cyclobacteriaceae bacterium]UYN88173.1 MAG: SDR family oxidoreductase [Cyclobacteriaceae bacterium]